MQIKKGQFSYREHENYCRKCDTYCSSAEVSQYVGGVTYKFTESKHEGCDCKSRYNGQHKPKLVFENVLDTWEGFD